MKSLSPEPKRAAAAAAMAPASVVEEEEHGEDEEEAERSGEAKVLDWLEEARLEVDRDRDR